MLDLRRLRYFRAIAEHGSLSAAARTLNIAQPALSHHIGEMERALETRLLERIPQGIRLTSIGLLLLDHARSILDAVDQAEAELREAAVPATATRVVSVAMIPTIAPLTPALIGLVEQILPDVSLHLIEARTHQSHEMIENGTVDLAVNLVDLQTVQAKPLFWEPLYFVSARSPGAKVLGKPMRFADLAGRRLISPAANNPVRVLIEKIAAEVGIQLNITVEIDGLDPRKQAVIAGLGGTFMSWLGVKEECEAGLLTLRTIIDPPVMRPMMLEHRAGLDSALVETMCDILKRIIEPAFTMPNA